MSKTISALAIATLLSLPASAAISRSLATNGSASCPTLEGYPDCHPDGSSAEAHIANMLAVVVTDLAAEQRAWRS